MSQPKATIHSANSVESVYLNRIETAVPPYEVHSKFVSFARTMIPDDRYKRIFDRLASKSHIEKRYSVLQPSTDPNLLDVGDIYRPGNFSSTAKRMSLFQEKALGLVREPLARLFSTGSLEPKDVTHLVVTSCTGFYAPGLDLEIQQAFGMRSDLERTLIGFMGCYAAMNAMKMARHVVRSDSDAKVLLVNVELCSLHMQENSDLERLLGFLQFGDGCSAAIVSAEPEGLRLDRFKCEVLEENQSLIRWNIGDRGFEMYLSTDVPNVLGRHLPGLLPRLLSTEELSELRHWAVHPGGRAILDAVEEKLELAPSALTHSREVLRNFGNMSSATIMFVLKDIMESGADPGSGLALAFGPGLTVESLVFEKMGSVS